MLLKVKQMTWLDLSKRKGESDIQNAGILNRQIMLKKETRKQYKEARLRVTKSVRKHKNEAIKKKQRALIENLDARGMGMKIRDDKNGFQARSHMYENYNGVLVTKKTEGSLTNGLNTLRSS